MSLRKQHINRGLYFTICMSCSRYAPRIPGSPLSQILEYLGSLSDNPYQYLLVILVLCYSYKHKILLMWLLKAEQHIGCQLNVLFQQTVYSEQCSTWNCKEAVIQQGKSFTLIWPLPQIAKSRPIFKINLFFGVTKWDYDDVTAYTISNQLMKLKIVGQGQLFPLYF